MFFFRQNFYKQIRENVPTNNSYGRMHITAYSEHINESITLESSKVDRGFHTIFTIMDYKNIKSNIYP